MSDFPERLRKRDLHTSEVFSPPPYFDELFGNKEFKEQFDKLPGNHRHFIRTLIRSGKFEKAAAEAKTGFEIAKNQSSPATFREELDRQGFNMNELVKCVGAAMAGKVVKVDKKGNHKEYYDAKTSLTAAKLILELRRGDYDSKEDQQNDVTELFKEETFDD